MRTRNASRGDVYPVAEQGLCVGFELGEVEVGTAVLQADHQLGSLGAQLDRADPVQGRRLGEETGALSEQAVGGGR